MIYGHRGEGDIGRVLRLVGKVVGKVVNAKRHCMA